MKRLWIAALCGAACGDNSQPPHEPGKTCGYGELLDLSSNTCLPDPAVCGAGTVLIDGVCRDPDGLIDLEEGPEPNGFETDATSAGNIVLKPIGDPNGFVVHGCIKPNGEVADFDDYRITVLAPTLIDVTADGVQGLSAGFVALGDDPALASWRRFGIDVQTETSHREVFLPARGTYELAIADTHTLLGLVAGTDPVAAGNPDGTSCYDVTIDQRAIPDPASLAVPDGAVGTIDSRVLFYSADLPNGVIDLQESIASTSAAPAFVISAGGAVRTDHGGEVAFVNGASSTSLIAVDTLFNYAPVPPALALTFLAATTAQALPRNGGTVTATSKPAGDTFNTTNQFYFDTGAGIPFGLELSSTKDVQGVVWDPDLNVVADFGGFGARQSFQSFVGAWRAPTPGRYVLALIDPVDGAGTAFTLTSKLTQIDFEDLAVDVPLTGDLPNEVDSNLYLVDLTTAEWDELDASGTDSGNLEVSVFDPSTAFGRLDPLAVTTDAGPAMLAPTPVPLLSHTFPSDPRGFVTFGRSSVLVKVNAQTSTATTTFDLDFTTRVKTDLVATSRTYSGETANGVHRYFIPSGGTFVVTVHPSGAEDPILEILNPDETVAATSNNPPGVDETLTYTATGYLAFSVRGTAQTYDLAIAITP